MATKVFDVGSMVCEDIQAYVRSCKFGTGTDNAFVPATVSDGAFVVLGGLADDTTYTGSAYTGMKDWNVKYAYAPASAALTADDVVVIDIDSVSNGVIAGNNYKIGNKLVDLQVEAGYPVRYRVIKKGDMFWLGSGNFASAPTVGQYANLTASSVLLTPAASTTPSQLNLAIRAAVPMTIGTTVAAGDYKYLVEVL